MESERLNVFHYPYWKFNSYHRELISSQNKLNLDVYSDSGKAGFQMMRLMQKADIIHLHQWASTGPSQGVRPRLRYLLTTTFALLVSFLFKTKIIMTIHNRRSPQNGLIIIQKLLNNLLIKCSSAFIVHGENIKSFVAEAYGIEKDRIFTINHPKYSVPSRPCEKIFLRSHLNIPPDDFIFMIFGAILPYKNIQFVIDAFERAEIENSHLLIVGRAKNDYYNSLQKKAVANLHFYNEYISEEHLPAILAEADCMVSNYDRDKVLTTGSTVLFMSHSKCIVAMEGLHLNDLNLNPELLYRPDDLDDCIQKLKKVSEPNFPRQEEGIKNFTQVEKENWETFSSKLLEVYKFGES